MSRQENYITEIRTASKNLLVSLQKLKDAQFEYNANNYGSTLTVSSTGSNSDIQANLIGPAIFDGADGLLAVAALANIAKIL